jgi:hypothetical protein
MNEPTSATADRRWFAPSWPRLGLALVAAAAGFFLPQPIPLEWYPLNEPGPDVTALEITCASNVAGEVQIEYDLARDGHRSLDVIRWPVSPTAQTYTYTFPLPDAPILELRVSPPAGGALAVRQMRVINRRGDEVRRFTRDLFRPLQGIAAIDPLPDGWQLVAAAGAAHPAARIELFVPLLPEGMAHRNFLRCLLSTGYLAVLLGILLLAVLCVFHRPARRRDFLRAAGYFAVLALLFAAVGNRGLIRNSLHYARFVPPVALPGLKLEIDVASTFRTPAQLFWDAGAGMGESTSSRAAYEPHDGLQTLRFALPATPVHSLRLDPGDSAGAWTVRGLRIVDHGQRTRLVLPLDSIVPVREIDRLTVGADRLHLATTGRASDPITGFKPETVTAISRLLAPPLHP